MSRQRLDFVGTGFLALIVIILVAVLIIQESPSKAYERGKIDGQLLVFEKWGDYDQETIDIFIECIHLISYQKLLNSIDSAYSADSTDTMPAVERLPIIIPDTGGAK